MTLHQPTAKLQGGNASTDEKVVIMMIVL